MTSGRRDLAARVLMYCGSCETIKLGPRSLKDCDFVVDMQRFAARLATRRYRSLRVEARVLLDEDHFTVSPSLVTRGLLQLLPGTGPCLSG